MHGFSATTHSLTHNSLVKVEVKAKIVSRVAVYGQSIRLGAKPFETYDQSFFD
jgi:hypothetical protein